MYAAGLSAGADFFMGMDVVPFASSGLHGNRLPDVIANRLGAGVARTGQGALRTVSNKIGRLQVTRPEGAFTPASLAPIRR